MIIEQTEICVLCQSLKTRRAMATDDFCEECICSSPDCTQPAECIVEYDDHTSANFCTDCGDDEYHTNDRARGIA